MIVSEKMETFRCGGCRKYFELEKAYAAVHACPYCAPGVLERTRSGYRESAQTASAETVQLLRRIAALRGVITRLRKLIARA